MCYCFLKIQIDMKLTEKPNKNKRTKAGEALRMEASAEENLNQRIGITPALKAELIEQTNFRTANFDSSTDLPLQARQCLVLFPEELELIIEHTNLVQLREVAMTQMPWEEQLEALYCLAKLDPKGLADLNLGEADKARFTDFIFNPPIDPHIALRQLVYAREIFGGPDLKKLDAKQATSFEKNLFKHIGRTWEHFIQWAYWYSRYDPSKYQNLHQVVLEHEQSIKKCLENVLEPRARPEYYTAFKLMLADNVDFLPNGEMVIREPKKLSVSPPLPERLVG